MRNIIWHYPETMDETRDLIQRDGTIPHGGGTGILRMSMRKVRGLIDLSGLRLDYYQKKTSTVYIGAAMTFNKVASHTDRESILNRALRYSASTPLRNRITVGGSVALFPIWSDIMGPLIALDAEVSLIGMHESRFPVVRYITEPDLRKGTLITEISLKDEEWVSYYYRETRTVFDYPAFTVTVLLRKKEELIDDMRVVLVGCRGKFRRFTDIERKVKGMKLSEVNAHELMNSVRVDFNGKKFLSGEYLKYIAGVQVERGLERVLV